MRPAYAEADYLHKAFRVVMLRAGRADEDVLPTFNIYKEFWQ